MLLDRKKYSGINFIGEDFASNETKELLHKCIVAEQSVSDGDFSLEEALLAYQLSKEDYETYIARKFQHSLFMSLSGSTKMGTSINPSYTVPLVIDIYVKMLDNSFDDETSELFRDKIGKIKFEFEEMKKILEKV